MTARVAGTRVLFAVALAGALGISVPAWAQSAQARYEAARTREAMVRQLIETTAPGASAGDRARVDRAARELVASYLEIVRRFPRSGYSDNALWQAASLHEALFVRYGRPADRDLALRYYRRMLAEYPTTSLVPRTRDLVRALEASAAPVAESSTSARAAAPSPRPFPVPGDAPRPASGERDSPSPADAPPGFDPAPAAPPPAAPAPTAPAADNDPEAAPAAELATLKRIDRAVLGDGVRVTLEFDREVRYLEDRIGGPPRLFFDFHGVEPAPPLVDAVQSYGDDVVRQVRVGRHPENVVRVVLELEHITRYSVFTLYNPFRLVIDCERPAAGASRADARDWPLPAGAAPAAAPVGRAPQAAGVASPAAPPAPGAPAANAGGSFSLSRQLGLGVSRIVIDPGHGGRDPGAHVPGLRESELVLDVALRLEKLLLQEPGIEVVMTRRTDIYVPLEERTAIANREGADLFLSIHANASRNTAARGIETYYLSFASSPEAEAVAARENAASERAMHNLADIIKAIALNDKLDESRELAAVVQESLVTRLRRTNKQVRNLGVKKAPFVVLIGASMPSVLAEISFLTNREEAALLKTSAYRQQIAEALYNAVISYRRSLKGTAVATTQDEG